MQEFAVQTLVLALLPFTCSFVVFPAYRLNIPTPTTMPPNQGLSPRAIVDLLDDERGGLDTQEFPVPTSSDESATFSDINSNDNGDDLIRVAILGCGMMGQEHCSYISGFPDLRIDYVCDPHQPSLDKAIEIIDEFSANRTKLSDNTHEVTILHDEDELLLHAAEIDLLVIASPNYLHTSSLTKWGNQDLTILVEKPVAVSQEQHDMLRDLMERDDFGARVWVAMEYRYIPAVAKLLQLLPRIGDIKMVTIRENRFPFLHKIGAWNRDPLKTGDTLVEKCCHFFDLFRLITSQEVDPRGVRSLAQRGLNYQDEGLEHHPIIDSAYVVMSFQDREGEEGGEEGGYESSGGHHHSTMGCLELCMFSEGSRHQEEIVVTGTKGRLEAYLPENKVFFYERPDNTTWTDRSIPPPREAIRETIFDCADVKDIHQIDKNMEMPTHGGYHYCSTAVEWYKLISAIKVWRKTGVWRPEVSLNDGLRAVDMGMKATASVVNERNAEDYYKRAHSCPVHD